MNKDVPITLISLTDKGDIISYNKDLKNPEYAPIVSRNRNSWIYEWWQERAIPLSRNNLTQMLHSKNINIPEEYLFKNLGLSLNDYYWIKPLDSSLKWKDVNLYSNSFKDNTLEWDIPQTDTPHYSPNSSLKGGLEKTWVIMGDDRYLVKGNKFNKSHESINEVVASKIHQLQGVCDYADYSLVKINNKPYDYGCFCKCFTSESKELVTAYDLILSEDKINTDSYYDHLLKVCDKNGMNITDITRNLDYMILTDFIMSQKDRHFNNIGFLRDAETLKFIGFSPIYDSGDSMYANTEAPTNISELSNLYTHGFADSAERMISLVKDPSVIDLTKLPPVSFIIQLYEKDTKETTQHIKGVCFAYEKRIEQCRNYQLGKPLNVPVYPVTNSKQSLDEKIKDAILQNHQKSKANHNGNKDSYDIR